MASDASPVSPAPIRAVAYVRVSQARDGMISPELQLRAIEDYCQRRQYQVTETLQDLDHSGRFWRHRQMERAITMIENNEADIIVVWRWSRVARHRLDWATAVDRVEAAGGRLDSANENFDTTTSTGRLARGILAELAAFESDRTGDIWREVWDRRVSQGLPRHGAPIFGYRKRNGHYIPDRKTGPILAELYRRYNDGGNQHALAIWLNAERVRPMGASRVWNPVSLTKLMDSGFAAGYIRHRGELLPGEHKPLISEDVWQAYLTRRSARRQQKWPVGDDYLLTGIVWCACGGQMHNTRKSERNAPRYACWAHPSKERGSTRGTTIGRNRCDGMVRNWVHSLVADEHARQAVTDTARRWMDRQATRARKIHDQIGTAPEADRIALLAELQEVRAAGALPSPDELALALLEDWDLLTPQGLQQRLHALVHRVVVFNDREQPLLEIHTTWGAVMRYVGVGRSTRVTAPTLSPTTDGAGPQTQADKIDPVHLLTPKEAARIARVTTQTLHAWNATGHLPNTQQSLHGHGLRYAIQDLRTMEHRYGPAIWT